MNFITYDYACCLYPKGTVVHKKALALKALTSSTRRGFTKYQNRGFDIQRLAKPEQQDLFCLDRIRWVGDGDAWNIELPVIYSIPPWERYLSPARATTWSIATFLEDRHCIHFYLWMDHRSVFPLIVASVGVHELVNHAADLLSFAFDEDADRTVNGDDEYVSLDHR